jgi:pyridoxamine 5'-phosphate oxidase
MRLRARYYRHSLTFAHQESTMPNEFLPDALPADPMEIVTAWFAEARARAVQPNPDAMVLASVAADGNPSARVVLCRHVDAAGYVVFYTNYESRKGRELTAHPRAAAVVHWDSLHRQIRFEGAVVHSPASESDAYFARRELASRIGAWASKQSQPLASRAALAEQVAAMSQRFGVAPGATSGEVPRPPHWGGFRLWIDSLELWIEGPGRIHDRALWRRALLPRDQISFDTGEWRSTRLNP